MKRVVIIGAGGHGRDVAEIIRHQAQSQSDLTFLGFVVDTEYLPDEDVPGGPILGDWSWFENADRDDLSIICALGDPAGRKRLVDRAQSIGCSFSNAISPLACVSLDAKIGTGVAVFPNALIGRNVLFADHSIINAGSTIGHDARIDRYGTLSPGVHIGGNASVGEGVFMGLGSIVIPGVSIGAWTTIAAGAVVTQNMPDHVTAAGVPARIIKTTRRPS